MISVRSTVAASPAAGSVGDGGIGGVRVGETGDGAKHAASVSIQASAGQRIHGDV
jgi:hypothetical protein